MRGAGRALARWHDGRVRIVSPVPRHARWLAEAFTRHFPEADGLPWPEPELTRAPVDLDVDPAAGLRAQAGDVGVELGGPMDRRRTDVAAFPGNGCRLSNVYVPCRLGVLRIGGRRVAGAPRVTAAPRPSSTAFLAEAEVWSGDVSGR